MTDLVKMKAKTTFHNDHIVGGIGGTVSDGDVFETDLTHAQDLQRLGHAEPVGGSLDGIEAAALEPHYQVSAGALAADRKRRANAPVFAEPVEAGSSLEAGK